MLTCVTQSAESDDFLPTQRTPARAFRLVCSSPVCLQVEAALEDGSNEFRSIDETKEELMRLQAEVQDAHQRLHVTQARHHRAQANAR